MYRERLDLFIAFALRDLSRPVSVGQALRSLRRLTVGTVFNETRATLNCQEVAGIVEELQWCDETVRRVARVRALTSTCDEIQKFIFEA